ncbi:N-acetylneuraminate synthase [Brevifollis gellanilyticus]|uniref:N-acetylneuraminate synthase n=1 Tax=Brevifollis gellanilyticus TaxID=748831 RepID=A0A512M6Y4_9BACT|nr:N-acetylneuraminate synthase [Brevifollis gellanilyticus]GEP42496.1 N-acetylneuraminate synthase [Brevifollis gellanilyticus]
MSLSQPPLQSDRPCFIIAEAGVNHNGDLELARQLVRTAAESGADAVKFQTFQAKHLVTSDAPQAAYQAENSGITESQFDMLKRLELPLEAFAELSRYCQELGIMFMSTAFDEESADFLAALGMSIFKIPSGELTNLPLLRHIARHGKPMIVSTGMGTLDEVFEAVDAIRSAGNDQITVLHCVTNYPAPPETVNLRAMDVMRTALGVPIGYSDHTMGIEASVIAVAAGAQVIEKHFTLDCNMPGPDHKASLEPADLTEMVRSIRRVEVLLGTGQKQPSQTELDVAKIVRRSVVAQASIPAGTLITEDMLVLRRPGTGIPPARFHEVPGKRALVDISEGSMIRWEDVA